MEIQITNCNDALIDHIGGHIKGSMHFPSRSLDAMMPSLVRELQEKETVVFHCALSQQRGPGAALRYMRERENHLAKKKKKGEETEESKDASPDADKDTKVPKQIVYVLDRGFVGWQETYGPDERLTEGYRKELWKDGYWV